MKDYLILVNDHGLYDIYTVEQLLETIKALDGAAVIVRENVTPSELTAALYQIGRRQTRTNKKREEGDDSHKQESFL